MAEGDLIERTVGRPATIDSLQRDLARLGVEPGMTLLCHSSLSALGWVCGGATAVILALENALGGAGTLVMPTHSTQLSDPSQWQAPPVPEAWWPIIREHMPAFRPDLTPTRGMGVIPETFRNRNDVLRSHHPHHSFAARGANAEVIVGEHSLHNGLGEGSPLARVYDLDGWILLLGVGHDSSTSLHLAEYRASFPSRQEETDGAPVRVDGRRQWVEVRGLNLNDDDFAMIGAAFAQETDHVCRGQIAQANALLMPQRALVDFSADWMEANRG